MRTFNGERIIKIKGIKNASVAMLVLALFLVMSCNKANAQSDTNSGNNTKTKSTKIDFSDLSLYKEISTKELHFNYSAYTLKPDETYKVTGYAYTVGNSISIDGGKVVAELQSFADFHDDTVTAYVYTYAPNPNRPRVVFFKVYKVEKQ